LLIRTFTLPGAIHRADREALNEPVYDFGARRDIRQEASMDEYANYLQRLDAEKYRRMIDRRATEAIDEFLTAKGIDNSDFSAKVNFHQYNSTTIGGSAYGPVVTGTSASAVMTTVAAAVTGKGKGSSS
jgi:nicotinic acid phosphoribosyltransferase